MTSSVLVTIVGVFGSVKPPLNQDGPVMVPLWAAVSVGRRSRPPLSTCESRRTPGVLLCPINPCWSVDQHGLIRAR